MYPHEDDPATTEFSAPEFGAPEFGAPLAEPDRAHGNQIGRRGRIAITTGVAVTLIAAGTGLGLALGGHDGERQPTNAASAASSPNAPIATPGSTSKPGRAEREAWARQYGKERSTLPNLPDVSSATAEQRAAASDLLTKIETATATYVDVTAAKAAGFDVQGTVAKAEQHDQKLAERISQADASGAVSRLPLLPVRNEANLHDGKVLDPSAPEALLYEYQAHGAWKLVGATFAANESYPQAPPDPGGPITRWSYGARGGDALTMRVFFAPGNDLAHAYAMSAQR